VWFILARAPDLQENESLRTAGRSLALRYLKEIYCQYGGEIPSQGRDSGVEMIKGKVNVGPGNDMKS
jgi:hypothetical protein